MSYHDLAAVYHRAKAEAYAGVGLTAKAHSHRHRAAWHASRSASFGSGARPAVSASGKRPEPGYPSEFARMSAKKLSKLDHPLAEAELRRRYEVYQWVMREMPEGQGALQQDVRDETLAQIAKSNGVSVEDLLNKIAMEEKSSFETLVETMADRGVTDADGEAARKHTAYARLLRQVGAKRSVKAIADVPFKHIFGLPIVKDKDEYFDAKSRAGAR